VSVNRSLTSSTSRTYSGRACSRSPTLSHSRRSWTQACAPMNHCASDTWYIPSLHTPTSTKAAYAVTPVTTPWRRMPRCSVVTGGRPANKGRGRRTPPVVESLVVPAASARCVVAMDAAVDAAVRFDRVLRMLRVLTLLLTVLPADSVGEGGRLLAALDLTIVQLPAPWTGSASPCPSSVVPAAASGRVAPRFLSSSDVRRIFLVVVVATQWRTLSTAERRSDGSVGVLVQVTYCARLSAHGEGFCPGSHAQSERGQDEGLPLAFAPLASRRDRQLHVTVSSTADPGRAPCCYHAVTHGRVGASR